MRVIARASCALLVATAVSGAIACTAVLGLDEYKPRPKDSGAAGDGSDEAGDGGACTDLAKSCAACVAVKCVRDWACMQPGQPCDGWEACRCKCSTRECFDACEKAQPATCEFCIEQTCQAFNCNDCYPKKDAG